jgi:hypothetical protein
LLLFVVVVAVVAAAAAVCCLLVMDYRWLQLRLKQFMNNQGVG